MIKKIRFRDMATTTTYLSLSGIRFYDSDGVMISPGKLISFSQGATIAEFDDAEVTCSSTFTSSSSYNCAFPFDVIRAITGSYSLNITHLTSVLTGQWLQIEFKKAIKGLSKIDFVPAPSDTARAVNQPFYIDAYDMNDQLVGSYYVTPITTLNTTQTLNTPELAVRGKTLLLDGGRLKAYRLPKIDYTNNLAAGKTCTGSAQASTAYAFNYLCNGINGGIGNVSTSTFGWPAATTFGTDSTYVSVPLGATYTVGMVAFNFRNLSTDTRFRDIKLVFSDGSSQTITLSQNFEYNANNMFEYFRITPVATSSIKIVPMTLYGALGTLHTISEFKAFPIIDSGSGGLVDLGDAPADLTAIDATFFDTNGSDDFTIPRSVVSQLSSSFDVLYKGPTSNYFPQLYSTACPLDQIVKTQDISLLGVQNIDNFTIINTALSGGLITVAMSFDSGATWYVHKNGSWTQITLDSATMRTTGMLPTELTTLTDWSPFLTNGKIKFALLIGIESTSDTALIDDLSSQWDLYGEFQVAVVGTDYNASFTDNKTLKVTFLTAGGYKVNY